MEVPSDIIADPSIDSMLSDWKMENRILKEADWLYKYLSVPENDWKDFDFKWSVAKLKEE